MFHSFKTFVAISVFVANLLVSTESKIVRIVRFEDFEDPVTNFNSQTTMCKPVTPPCIVCVTPSKIPFQACSDPPITFKYGCPDITTCKCNPCTRPPTTRPKSTTRPPCTACSTTKLTTKCTCSAQVSTTAATPPTQCPSCRSKYKHRECVKSVSCDPSE